MQKKFAPLPLIVITFVNMCLLGFLNSMRGVSFPLIKTGFDASYNDMGLLTALVSFSAVCFCIIAGFFMSRFGLKKTVVAAFIFLTAGATSLYYASSFWMAAGLYLILQSGFGFLEIGLNGTGVRIFTVKSGLMLNLLHFCYGLGAIGGPRFMGLMVTRNEMRWQDVYPLALIPALIMLIITLIVRFPGRAEAAVTNASGVSNPSIEKRHTFMDALKDPLVWLFGFILGISGSIEGCSVAWSGLFLYDVYGLDPATVGATFVSVFYILFTLSRLVSGFAIEKIGLLKSILFSSLAIIVLLITAFSLGRNGIYLLPVTGFFIALMWPTILAITVGVFKEKAQTASSAMISIAFTTSGIIQYGFGLSNRFLGAAWAYRSCVLYGIVLFILLFMLAKKNKALGWNVR